MFFGAVSAQDLSFLVMDFFSCIKQCIYPLILLEIHTDHAAFDAHAGHADFWVVVVLLYHVWASRGGDQLLEIAQIGYDAGGIPFADRPRRRE